MTDGYLKSFISRVNNQRYLAVLFLGSSLILYLQGLNILQLTPLATYRIQPRGYPSRHPAFSKSCYTYSNMKAHSVCGPMLNYTHQNVLECLRQNYSITSNEDSSTATKEIRLNERPWEDRQDGTHWVFLGDSRLRQLFSAIVLTFDKKNLMYRMEWWKKGEWKDIEKVHSKLSHFGKFHASMEVVHRSIPLRITFFWDPTFSRFKNLAIAWEKDKYQRPTTLFIGVGLHISMPMQWIYQYRGEVSAALPFWFKMLDLRPALQKMSYTNDIIFMKVDHVQKQHTNENLTLVWSDSHINYYNDIIMDILKGTDVSLWDSASPLADLYIKECHKKHISTNDLQWRCEDGVHFGKIVIDQLVNMFYNDHCNDLLAFDKTFII